MNIFQQLSKSIYSPKSISQFRFQGIGKTILFVFFLSLLATLPIAINFSNGLINGLKGFDQTLENELPDFSIEDGTLISKQNKPIEIRKEEFIIVFDPTGSFNVEAIEKKHNAIGFLQNQFVLSSNGVAQTYEYQLLNMDLTKKEIISYIKQINSLLPIILSLLFISMYLFTSATKFIEITILALFGSALKNSLNRKVNFKQLWVMSAYAITLATIFFTIMEAVDATVPGGFLINWFVHIIVLYLVLKEIPPSKNTVKA